ncbi:hypothetical protein GSI_03874 [Ganoderma sinense ZZ0214-1]|uniref:Uncharacterized protein n=1 Tax=Ganoderma sinense ZZ0214-1 TaxID=1077348 RepID=A0A2G8SK88_9APHY|nr:hypothetical protein GSI_03874 [Ganoderma sinense ZZ0214-1]
MHSCKKAEALAEQGNINKSVTASHMKPSNVSLEDMSAEYVVLCFLSYYYCKLPGRHSTSAPEPPLLFSHMDADSDAHIASVLLSVILEGVFFLLFVVTYIFGSWVIICGVPPGRLKRPSTALFIAGTAMFVLAGVVGCHSTRIAAASMLTLGVHQHFALDLHIMVSVSPMDIENHIIPSWYDPVHKAKFVIYVTQTLIADGFMVRTILNHEERMIHCNASTDISAVVEGMIQSAFLYSAASVVLVVTIFASAHVAYVACLNVFPALSGLVFSFIVIRVGLQSTEAQYLPVSQMQESHLPATSIPGSPSRRHGGSREHQPPPLGMRNPDETDNDVPSKDKFVLTMPSPSMS